MSVHECCNDRGYGRRGQHERQEAVAELHVLVPRLSLAIRRYVGTLHAFGPRRASETAAGDAHDRAGQDDSRLRDEVGDVDAADPAGCLARMASVPSAGRIWVLSRAG